MGLSLRLVVIDQSDHIYRLGVSKFQGRRFSSTDRRANDDEITCGGTGLPGHAFSPEQRDLAHLTHQRQHIRIEERFPPARIRRGQSPRLASSGRQNHDTRIDAKGLA